MSLLFLFWSQNGWHSFTRCIWAPGKKDREVKFQCSLFSQIKKNLYLILQRLSHNKTLLIEEKIQASFSRNGKERVKADSRAILTAGSRNLFLPGSFSRLRSCICPPYSRTPHTHRTSVIFHPHCRLDCEDSEKMCILKSPRKVWWRGPGENLRTLPGLSVKWPVAQWRPWEDSLTL